MSQGCLVAQAPDHFRNAEICNKGSGNGSESIEPGIYVTRHGACYIACMKGANIHHVYNEH